MAMLSNDAVLAVTHMGNSVLMLSSALVLAIWLGLVAAWRVCLVWVLAIGVAVLLVLATKIAFFGWGWGIAQIDFTGVSGHAMLATAVLPTLAAAMTLRASLQASTVAVGLAFVLAVAVGLSRIALGAHSLSEVLTGWLVGLLVTLLTLRGLRGLRGWHVAPGFRASPWPLVVANLLLLTCTAPRTGQGPETHGMVVKIALWASDRTEPFSRAMLHGRSI